ncbi:hypothetical protein XENOCAPTIV_022870, partial [Xenoophorus captivus]
CCLTTMSRSALLLFRWSGCSASCTQRVTWSAMAPGWFGCRPPKPWVRCCKLALTFWSKRWIRSSCQTS